MVWHKKKYFKILGIHVPLLAKPVIHFTVYNKYFYRKIWFLCLLTTVALLMECLSTTKMLCHIGWEKIYFNYPEAKNHRKKNNEIGFSLFILFILRFAQYIFYTLFTIFYKKLKHENTMFHNKSEYIIFALGMCIFS